MVIEAPKSRPQLALGISSRHEDRAEPAAVEPAHRAEQCRAPPGGAHPERFQEQEERDLRGYLGANLGLLLSLRSSVRTAGAHELQWLCDQQLH